MRSSDRREHVGPESQRRPLCLLTISCIADRAGGTRAASRKNALVDRSRSESTLPYVFPSPISAGLATADENTGESNTGAKMATVGTAAVARQKGSVALAIEDDHSAWRPASWDDKATSRLESGASAADVWTAIDRREAPIRSASASSRGTAPTRFNANNGLRSSGAWSPSNPVASKVGSDVASPFSEASPSRGRTVASGSSRGAGSSGAIESVEE